LLLSNATTVVCLFRGFWPLGLQDDLFKNPQAAARLIQNHIITGQVCGQELLLVVWSFEL
jgi:hypothetical protein